MNNLKSVLALLCVLCVMGGIAVWWAETKIAQVTGAAKEAVDSVSGAVVEFVAGDQVREAQTQIGANIAKGVSSIEFIPGSNERKANREHKEAVGAMANEITEKAKQRVVPKEQHPDGLSEELQLLMHQLAITDEYQRQGLVK
jgi:hypothetical protein